MIECQHLFNMGVYYILYCFVYLKFHNENKITNQEITVYPMSGRESCQKFASFLF